MPLKVLESIHLSWFERRSKWTRFTLSLKEFFSIFAIWLELKSSRTRFTKPWKAVCPIDVKFFFGKLIIVISALSDLPSFRRLSNCSLFNIDMIFSSRILENSLNISFKSTLYLKRNFYFYIYFILYHLKIILFISLDVNLEIIGAYRNKKVFI